MTLADRIRSLPDRPGIYLFKDEQGRPLYVGKAKSLRKRVGQYLRTPEDPRIATMVSEATEIEVVLTDTEAEALLLENTWIKRRRPRYNVLLRDDKTYPYLALTADPYPRLVFTRRIRRDGAEYFGPFLPAGVARRAIPLVQKLFEIRVCSIEIDGSLPRPCLYHDMRRCLGPCVDGLTTPAVYSQAVSRARLFLLGRNDELLKEMRLAMWAAAEATRYEEAARLRDGISEIEAISERRKLSSTRGEDVDVFGIHADGHQVAVVVLVMRGGQLLDRQQLFWEGTGEVGPEAVLGELLPQFYHRSIAMPKEIHLPFEVEGEEVLAEWLSERRGDRVYLRHPARGPKADRVGLAMQNARLAFRRRFRESAESDPGAEALGRRLGLAEPPGRIEGFDVSHLQGGDTVASLVVWEGGRMRKSEYRSFNIRDADPGDDFGALAEAVHRSFARRLEEGRRLPDLLLIDGGRGQLNAALGALAGLEAETIPVVGLAKREEEIFVPALPQPLRLPRDDHGLRLLQAIRDEAHRFAVSRHRRRRQKRTLGSRLESLPGVGPRRRRLLLRRFGSLDGVRAASVSELQAALGPNLGQRVFEALALEGDDSSEAGA